MPQRVTIFTSRGHGFLGFDLPTGIAAFSSFCNPKGECLNLIARKYGISDCRISVIKVSNPIRFSITIKNMEKEYSSLLKRSDIRYLVDYDETLAGERDLKSLVLLRLKSLFRAVGEIESMTTINGICSRDMSCDKIKQVVLGEVFFQLFFLKQGLGKRKYLFPDFVSGAYGSIIPDFIYNDTYAVIHYFNSLYISKVDTFEMKGEVSRFFLLYFRGIEEERKCYL